MSDVAPYALILTGGEITSVSNDQVLIHSPGVPIETILNVLPEDLTSSVNVIDWSRQPSSHYTIRMVVDLIGMLQQQVVNGANAVVVTCGTDTVEEVAYLVDLLWSYPQPVVFCVSMLPIVDENSEGTVALTNAVKTALHKESWGKGVLVCAHNQIFAAADVVEVSNYRRINFDSINHGPIGEIIDGKVYYWLSPKRPNRSVSIDTIPVRNVELIYSYLGIGDRVVNLLADPKNPNPIDGLVIAGFGGGNISPAWVSPLKLLIKSEIPVLVTSRCISGHIMARTSYEGSFRRIRDLGVIDGGFLHPVKARLKLAVGIGAGFKDEDLQRYILS